jgi:hypothetical protein
LFQAATSRSRGTSSRITIPRKSTSTAPSFPSQPNQKQKSHAKFEISNGRDIQVDCNSVDGHNHTVTHTMMDVDEDCHHEFSHSHSHYEQQNLRQPSRINRQKEERLQTSLVIGGPYQETQQGFSTVAQMTPPILNNMQQNNELFEQSHVTVPTRMEIDDILPKAPLIVMDGANVAYAYTHATGTSSSLNVSSRKDGGIEPDSNGIKVAVNYFVNAGCRVLVVLPQHWMRSKPRADAGFNGTFLRFHLPFSTHALTHPFQSIALVNSKMVTPQLEILQELQSQNRLCLSPPTDDDDAYAITIARREDKKAKDRRREVQNSFSDSQSLESLEGAYVLSNDLFRDAMDRDVSGELREWLGDHRFGKGYKANGTFLAGRLSFSFCNVGSIDDFGDPMLDFLPNPRHQLVEIIEKCKAHTHYV